MPATARKMRLRQLAYSPLRWFERGILAFSAIPLEPYLDPHLLPWAAVAEERWDAVRAELDAILDDGYVPPSVAVMYPDAANIATRDAWTSYFFYAYGRWLAPSCERCPETARLLRSIPDLQGAFFAFLEPRSVIVDHRGPWRGQLRYHLGLRTPADSGCDLTVDGQTRAWQAGASLLFDDGYIHSARNETNERRAVLLITVARPFRRPADQVNRAFLWLCARPPRRVLARARGRMRGSFLPSRRIT